MVVAALAITSTQYLPYWQSGLTLFTRAAAMEKTPDATIEDKLGDSLMSAGRVDEALIHFQRSCELEPYFDACNFNLAEILFARYDARAALEHYQTALEHTQDESLAIRCLINSGEAMLSLGDLNGAQLQLSHALRLDPGNQNARQLLERVNAGLGSPSTY
jgi:tetratricopeptide (TPR) repeat protein